MAENKKVELEKFHARAKLPQVLRAAAVFGIIAAVLLVGIGFYLGSFRKEFRMKSLPTSLSENVVAVVDGYERKESENSVLKYTIKADRATTFDDQHQELENVFLQVYVDGDLSKSDSLRAEKAIYVPDDKNSKDFRIFFAGDVRIVTRDDLEVRTDQLTYTKATETAEAEEYIEFERQNISGNAVGAVVKINEKTLQLLSEVNIFSGSGGSDPQFARPEIKTASIRAGNAFVDQEAETIDLNGDVDIIVEPEPGNSNLKKTTRIRGNSAKAFLSEKQLRRVELNGNATVSQEKAGPGGFTNAKARSISADLDGDLERLEMEGGVEIETAPNDGPASKILSQTAEYSTSGESFELDGGVRITTISDGRNTDVKADHAVYKQASGEVFLTGNASVSQGADRVSGNQIHATLFPDQSLRSADVSGNAAVVQAGSERNSTLKAQEIKARFNKSGSIASALALGGSEIEVIPLNRSDYSRYALSTPSVLRVEFSANGRPVSAGSDGRTTIRLTAVDNGPESSDKMLTADSVNTKFTPGKDELASAEANGNAHLVILPKTPDNGKYRTEVRAPRFVCDFYGGNNAKSCTGIGKSQATRSPLVGNGPDQKLGAEKFIARFSQKTKDLSELEAVGSAKFSEGDRQGLAARIIYGTSDETARFRGEPAVWDSTARVKADAIDWEVSRRKSSMSGGVRATYYGNGPAGGSTPFSASSSPVFVSSDAASFDHAGETAVFVGKARAWQDKNYVRANRLLIEQKSRRFYAEGDVQSLLYDAQRTSGGKRSSVPVYAESQSMIYLDGEKLIRYEKKVDIRQGPERIRAERASINLNKQNELVSTVVEENVVITQPGRKATGSYAKYDAVEEMIVLRGDPATVLDEERGSSSGREVVVNLRQNVVTGTGKGSPNGAGRIRSVYKLKDGDLN